jgi:hypothetical protein
VDDSEGAIIKSRHTKKVNKPYTPSVTILFVDKDLPLANIIAQKLQATIKKAKGNYYVLSVYKQSALYDLAKLVNGKFRTRSAASLRTH